MSFTSLLTPGEEAPGRYHGPARVVLSGDSALGARYIPLGRNLLAALRASLDAGGITYGQHFAALPGVMLRVQYADGVNQIFIHAVRPGGVSALEWVGGYQFYTTSPTVQWATWNDPSNFCPGGSLIYAPAPNLKLGATPSDAANVKLFAKPLYTLVEPAPEFDGTPECPSVTMPSSVGDTESGIGLDRIMNQEGFKIKGTWQIEGIGEPVSYNSTPELKDLNPTGYDKLQASLLNAWLQTGGTIANYDIQGFSPTYGLRDVGFDMSPGRLPSGTQQTPDADWPDRSCLRYVGSSEFGGRWFVIMHTANDEWWCWPLLNVGQLDPAIASDASPELKAQAYKANVPSVYAQSAFPPYPEWVYAPNERLSLRSDPLRSPPRPRYTFTFTGDGTKAIAAMVERTPLDEVNSKAWKTEFINPDEGPGLSRTRWAQLNLHPSSLYFAPIEKESDSLTIDGMLKQHNESIPPGRQPFCYDRLGIVELAFTVTITGPELSDFEFSVAISDEQSPDALDAYDVGALVDVAFAKPMVSYPTSSQVMAKGVVRSAQVSDANKPQRNERVTAFMTLYQTRDQEKYSLGAYQYGRYSVSKSKVSFYKNRDYQSGTPILELPLSQTHGLGYVGQPSDPDIQLPGEAHEFVDVPFDSTLQRHRPSDDPHAPRFIYDARILSLDLSTLSFIYTLVVNELSTDDTPVSYEFYKEFNQQTELCNVYVFGTIAHETYAGVKGDHCSFLAGMGDAVDEGWPTADEIKIPTTFKNNSSDKEFDYSEPYGNPTVWWLTGLCGSCVYLTLQNAVDDTLPQPNENGVWEGPFPYVRVGDGRTLTEEDAKNYLRYAVTEWGEFLAGNKQHLRLISLEGPVIIPTDYFLSVILCLGGVNPFVLARDGFSLEKFIEQSAWYMMELGNLFTEFYDAGVGKEQAYLAACGLMSRDLSYSHVYSDYGLGLSYLDPVSNWIRLKNFDWGINLYNDYRANRITSEPMTDAYGAVLTSIEGHYSFYYRGHYALNKKYTALAWGFTQELQGKPLSKTYPISTFYDGRTYETRVFNDEDIDGDSFDWQRVDEVGWYCGAVKVSHLDMYNMAFDETWRNTQRENGRGTPYALQSELPIETKYSAPDFRPRFDFRLSAVGEPLYSPNCETDGMYLPLQLEANKYWIYYLYSYYGYPGSTDYDSREEKTHLRLSPLFF